MAETPSYRRIEERRVYQGERVEVYEDAVRFPDGHEGAHTWVRHRGSAARGVVVIAPDGDGRVLLVRMHRYLFPDASWEFVRGSLDEGETPEQAARRELGEETALEAGTVAEIGVLRPDTGIWTTEVSVVVATVSDATRIEPQHDEGIATAEFMPLATVWNLVADGEVKDGITLAALALLAARERPQG